MALVAGVFIVAPDVRMSILAMGSPMRPYTLTQTDQSISKFPLQTGRAIRFFEAQTLGMREAPDLHVIDFDPAHRQLGNQAPQREVRLCAIHKPVAVLLGVKEDVESVVAEITK